MAFVARNLRPFFNMGDPRGWYFMGSISNYNNNSLTATEARIYQRNFLPDNKKGFESYSDADPRHIAAKEAMYS